MHDRFWRPLRFFLTLCCAGGLFADAIRPSACRAASASPTVPVGDSVYEDLDRLDALGLLPSAILGHKPLSRNEVVGLVATADSLARAGAPGGAGSAVVREILTRLRARWAPARAGRVVTDLSVTVGAAQARVESRPVLRSNGLGSVDGADLPLTNFTQAALYGRDGPTAWAGAALGAQLGRGLAIGAAGELRAGRDGARVEGRATADNVSQVRFRALYARANPGTVSFQVGRVAQAWGPTTQGGSLLSTNAPPMDLLLLACERPYRFPGFLRYVGPVRQSLCVADLGAERTLRHAKLLAVRQTFRVTRHLELGFTETLVLWGEGAPRVSPGNLFYELIPVRGRNGRTDLSDHRYGMDGRVQVWPGHLLAYGDVFIDDSRAPLYKYFNTLLAKRVGLYAPALGPGGRWEARVEWADIPAISYRHTRWTTGYAMNGRLLGDPLGPDARGAHAELTATLRAGHRLGLTLDREGRDADIWSQEPGDDPDLYKTIYRVQDNPTEWRTRVGLRALWRASDRCDITGRASFENVSRPLSGRSGGTDHLVEIGVLYRPKLD